MAANSPEDQSQRRERWLEEARFLEDVGHTKFRAKQYEFAKTHYEMAQHLYDRLGDMPLEEHLRFISKHTLNLVQKAPPLPLESSQLCQNRQFRFAAPQRGEHIRSPSLSCSVGSPQRFSQMAVPLESSHCWLTPHATMSQEGLHTPSSS